MAWTFLQNVLVLTFVFCFESLFGFLAEKRRTCEVLQSQLCQNTASYNTTSMPNYVGHKNQLDADLEINQFHPLIKINCSPELSSFLCSVYFPECHLEKSTTHLATPCLSTCIKAYRGCSTLMAKFGFQWPEKLNCHLFENGAHCPPLTEIRPFIPSNANLTVKLEITYNASSITYGSCCSTYHNPSSFLNLNDLGDSFANPADVRTGVDPLITWSTQDNDDEKLFSVLMTDPDFKPPLEVLGTEDKPLIHYQVINIPNGRIQDGNETLSYVGPAPPFDQTHNYYFLLYQQNVSMDPAITRKYSGKNCTALVSGRCMYDLNGFVTDNNLHLVGIKTMRVQTDPFVRYVWTQLFGFPKEQYCQNVTGYKEPCPDERNPPFFLPMIFG